MPPLHIAIATSSRFAALHHFTTRFIATPIGAFVAWLTMHTGLAYVVLLIGAYFDALVGPSFFIPGEVIFLGGSILGSKDVLNIWIVIVCLYAGGILGDSTSYWIGRWLGTSVFKEKSLFGIKHHQRVEKLVDKYGPKALFFARLIGPFSKIAPVTAGILKIPFPTFLKYNIPGVLVGIGEFIIVGYFFGENYEQVLGLLERYIVVFFAVATVVGIVVWQYFAHRSRKSKKALRDEYTIKDVVEELEEGIL